MIQSAADNQYKLLEVINELFTYVIDPYTGKRVIRINPNLTDLSLQKSVEKTRKLIVNLYVKCESDYVNGIQIFEAIVEKKILETTQKQIENLKKDSTKIIEETKRVVPTKEVNPNVINDNQDMQPKIDVRVQNNPPIQPIKPIQYNQHVQPKIDLHVQNNNPPIQYNPPVQPKIDLHVQNNPPVPYKMDRPIQNDPPTPYKMDMNVQNDPPLQSMQNKIDVQRIQNNPPTQNIYTLENLKPRP
jgi:hypothetical protein